MNIITEQLQSLPKKIIDLIYFESFSNIEQAIAREKQLKNWHKKWKLNLIKTTNPTLKTLDY